MAIPEMNDEGCLPIGVHPCTLEEVRERFGTFRSTDRRSELFEHLQAFIHEARSTSLVKAVIIDGSIVTAHENPNDIDLLLVLFEGHDFGETLRPFQYNVLSRRRVHRRYPFDLLVAPEQTTALEDFIAFFQQVRNEPDRAKGMLRIDLMITDDRQLQQAIEQLGRMQHALAYFCKEVLPKGREQFAVLAEGPLDEIRRLEEEIKLYVHPPAMYDARDEAASVGGD